MSYYKIPIFRHTPPTADMCYEALSELSYQSPIEIIMGQLRVEREERVEGEIFKAIQEVGVTVDKDELVKALQYDRDQYAKGFKDGCKDDIDKLCQEIRADTVRKMQERLKAEMSFGRYIQAEQIDQIAKEMLEDDK